MQIDWKTPEEKPNQTDRILFLYHNENDTLDIAYGYFKVINDIDTWIDDNYILQFNTKDVEGWIYLEELIPVIKKEVHYYYPLINDAKKKPVAEWLARCNNAGAALLGDLQNS